MRIAIISSPRSGNTWLRNMITETLVAQTIAVHRLEDITELQNNLVLQIHLLPSHENITFFKDNNFKIITLLRHPLDVLISALRFAQYEPDVKKWVYGKGGAEKLDKSTPLSKQFFEYATSSEFRTLLRPSFDWMGLADSIIRFEDLKSDPISQLKQSLSTLSVEYDESSLNSVVEKNHLGVLKATANNHGWRGISNNWVNFIQHELAGEIMLAHKDIFELMKYDIDDARLDLTNDAILRNWESSLAVN